MDQDFSRPRAGLLAAVAARAFPCAVAEVGTSAGVAWTGSFGTLTYEDGAARAALDTVFDLASLTKVIASTTLAMRAVEEGWLALDDWVAKWIPAWRGRDRETVTVEDLLAHCSGLTGHLPFYRDCEGRREFEHAIATLALEYPPRSRAVYSDLGFILLGFLLSDAGHAGLDAQFEALASSLDLGEIAYRPPGAWRPRTAPTGVNQWRRRLLVGEVHDDNGWALGGVAGHTGLFGTAPAVGRFARGVLLAMSTGGPPAIAGTETLRRFRTRGGVPGSSRALGWDTMLATSSCGALLSPTAIGHTGFTGTSLWIDWERDAYFVLLTNRVHPTSGNEAILTVRREFHSAAVLALDRA